MFARSIKEEALHAEVETDIESKGILTDATPDVIDEAALKQSPALALQDRLKQSLEAPADMSSRRVFATFLVVCLSCWVAGIGLYALL